MKSCLFAFILIGAALVYGQPTSAPATARGRGPAAAPPPAAPMPDATVTGGMQGNKVYPTNMATIDTPKAGILGLRAIDIPRYTQTGPFPDPLPTRPTVNSPSPQNSALPTIWTIGDSATFRISSRRFIARLRYCVVMELRLARQCCLARLRSWQAILELPAWVRDLW